MNNEIHIPGICMCEECAKKEPIVCQHEWLETPDGKLECVYCDEKPDTISPNAFDFIDSVTAHSIMKNEINRLHEALGDQQIMIERLMVIARKYHDECWWDGDDNEGGADMIKSWHSFKSLFKL